MSVEADVRTYLLAASGYSPIYLGGVRKAGNGVPHNAIFVRETPGYMPNEFMDGGVSKTYRFSEVQIRVRSDKNGYLTGKAIADDVWIKMQKVSSASISTGSTSYVRVFNLQSSPLYLGEEDDETSGWTLNIRCEHGG